MLLNADETQEMDSDTCLQLAEVRDTRHWPVPSPVIACIPLDTPGVISWS